MNNTSCITDVSNNIVVNVAQVRQLSPFRYPGGKTWLVPEMRHRVAALRKKPVYFVEPFAGGAIISLTAASEDWADKIIFCELDHMVAAVWHSILEYPDWLCERITTFDMNLENVRELLDKESESLNTNELAFQTIVRNRVQHGGKIAAGASLIKVGENGKGILSRWYPQTIVNRIQAISALRNKLEFVEGDGFDLINEYLDCKEAFFFVDPPYTAGGKNAGKRLYNHNEINHNELFRLLGNSAGNFVMTYDYCSEVIQMACMYKFKIEKILMKNTHNNVIYELLIGNSHK